METTEILSNLLKPRKLSIKPLHHLKIWTDVNFSRFVKNSLIVYKSKLFPLLYDNTYSEQGVFFQRISGSMPHSTFEWIITCQDHLTKICVLQLLISKRISVVAFQLADLSATRCFWHASECQQFWVHLSSCYRDPKIVRPKLTPVHDKLRHRKRQAS